MLAFIAAYSIFRGRTNPAIVHIILSAGYAGTFVSGMMFAYGFTVAFGTAMLLMLAKRQNLFLAAEVGGLGSLLAVSSYISQKLFSVLSFLLNSTGIIFMLSIGRAIAA